MTYVFSTTTNLKMNTKNKNPCKVSFLDLSPLTASLPMSCLIKGMSFPFISITCHIPYKQYTI